jgi:hypothetical protein
VLPSPELIREVQQNDDAKRSSACVSLPPDFLRELAEINRQQRAVSHVLGRENCCTVDGEQAQGGGSNGRGGARARQSERPVMIPDMESLSLVELFHACRRREGL